MANVRQSMTLSSQTTLELLLLIDRISSSGLELGGIQTEKELSKAPRIEVRDGGWFLPLVFFSKIPIIQETKKRCKLTPENRRECEIGTSFNLVSLMLKPFQKKNFTFWKTNIWKKTKKKQSFSLDLPTVNESISGKVMEMVSFKFWILMDDPPGFKKPSQIFRTMSSPLPQNVGSLRLVAAWFRVMEREMVASKVQKTEGGTHQQNQYHTYHARQKQFSNPKLPTFFLAFLAIRTRQ